VNALTLQVGGEEFAVGAGVGAVTPVHVAGVNVIIS
jgi:hypothetical protein